MQNKKHFPLDDIKAEIIIEAERAQHVSQLLIEQLHLRAKRLENKAAKLQEKAKNVLDNAVKLHQQIEQIQQEANQGYKNSLSIIINSFGVDPPWDAAVIFKENLPVGIDLSFKDGLDKISNSQQLNSEKKYPPRDLSTGL